MLFGSMSVEIHVGKDLFVPVILERDEIYSWRIFFKNR